MCCTPVLCWVQPTAYTQAVVFSRPLAADQRVSDPAEVGRADAADLLDQLRRVPGEVPLQHLEHAPRMRSASRPARRSAASWSCRRSASAGRSRRTDRRRPRRRRSPPAGCRLRWCRRVTYSRNSCPPDSTWLISAPRNTMSPPALRRHVQVRVRAGPGEPRVDVDDGRAARLRLDHPLERDRVALGHVRTADDDAVGVNQIARKRGGPAATEASPQTGDGGGVSYPRLVLDLDRAERGPELLDEVVLLVVQRRAAEAGEAERAPDSLAVDASPARWLPWSPAPGRRSCPSPRSRPSGSHTVP